MNSVNVAGRTDYLSQFARAWSNDVMSFPRLSRRRFWVPATIMVALLTTAGLYWFAPWKLVVDDTVNEKLPVLVSPSESAVTTPEGPTLVAEGTFISHEHETTGEARLVRAPDGTHELVIDGLSTSNGPDLRVWLTDQPVIEGEWFTFDDGYYAELGKLKGNIGDQRYSITPDVDLDRVTSVSIWCARFSVSFGAATLLP